MELLAPAGGWEAFLAAMENGADAVYIGGKNYSARHSAENFDDDQIKAAVEYAHCRNKKVYVTVNTLIDNTEFEAALDYIYHIHNLGVDAIIVQDLGLLQAADCLMPAVRLHASTQMTIHNAAGVEFVTQHGARRVVLARELSLEHLRSIHQAVPDTELEYFIHGALCYCYSGQCLFSSMVGGRSGNRGRCAQPCRLAYRLFSGSTHNRVELKDAGKYLLSPADLCLLPFISLLQQAGVTSLKIEGRMKRPEYVATVARTYREVLDRLEQDENYNPPAQLADNLLKIFNRNFSSGYLFPRRGQFLSTTRPNNRGVYVGRVMEQSKNYETSIKLVSDVSVGDGLDVWVSKGRGPACTVRQMRVNGNLVEEADRGDIITVQLNGPAGPGDRVFKTHDARLLARAMESIRPRSRNKILIKARVTLRSDQPMQIRFIDGEGHIGEAFTNSCAQTARKHPLTEDVLRDKLERLGNTPFELGEIEFSSDPGLMMPFSDINEARRQAVEDLCHIRLQASKPPEINYQDYLPRKREFLAGTTGRSSKKPLLSIMVSTLEQAEAAIKSGADQVYLGLEGLMTRKRLTAAELNQLAESAGSQHSQLIPALPRIQTPGQERAFEVVSASGLPVLAGNPGSIRRCLEKGWDVRGDYTLNVFNRFALRFLLQEGLAGVCLSPELNFTQLGQFPNLDQAELLVHGELIIMLSQYCMLSGVMGQADKCPGFCQQDHYYLKDELGYEFPVETDADCRFYVFNSRTLCMLDELDKVMALRPGSIRIEARRMKPEAVRETLTWYRRALDEIWAGLKPDLQNYKELLLPPGIPFTRCHFYRGVL